MKTSWFALLALIAIIGLAKSATATGNVTFVNVELKSMHLSTTGNPNNPQIGDRLVVKRHVVVDVQFTIDNVTGVIRTAIGDYCIHVDENSNFVIANCNQATDVVYYARTDQYNIVSGITADGSPLAVASCKSFDDLYNIPGIAKVMVVASFSEESLDMAANWQAQ